MINEWQSLWPDRNGRIGHRQAMIWLIVCLLLTVYVATYFRVSLQVVFKLMTLKGFDGKLYHVVAGVSAVVLYAFLARFFERCLFLPCFAATNGELPKQPDSSWKLLLGLNAVCIIMPAFSIVYELLMGKHNLSPSQWSRLLLLLAIGAYSFRLAVGAELTSPHTLPEGKIGSFASLVVGVSVWSNACFLLSASLYMPYYGTIQYVGASIQHAGYGALVALTLWQLKGTKWPVVLGLAVSFLGGPAMGTALSRAVGVLSVGAIDYWQARDNRVALIRMWGFGLGQGAGRIIGGLLGSFYLGVDGGEVGAVVGESVAALLGFDLIVGSTPEAESPAD